MPSGWINERLNTSDWDYNVGGVFYGSTWAEVSLMLTCIEIPGIYLRTDTGEVVAFDHVQAKAHKTDGQFSHLEIHNPTAFSAKVKILCEDLQQAAKPLGHNYLWEAEMVSLQPGETVFFTPSLQMKDKLNGVVCPVKPRSLWK
jgi:hypothetical protein